MAQENITLNLKASIDTSVVERDLQAWTAQEKILRNTGIERDGGMTNLYAEVESNSQYVETFYTSDGSRVQLKRDDINNSFRVIANGNDIGGVPQWAINTRSLIPADANDCIATIDGTFILLFIASSIATLTEIDGTTLEPIRSRSFGISALVTDGIIVRTKQPTWANTTSIIGHYLASGTVTLTVITDASTVLFTGTIASNTGIAGVNAYYERGYILSAMYQKTVGLVGQTWTIKSDGTLDTAYTSVGWLVKDYNEGTTNVVFRAWRDLVDLATMGIYGYTFTPPAALGLAWTVASVTDATITGAGTGRAITFGGFGLMHSTTKYSFFNHSTVRDYTVNHAKAPEVYGQAELGSSVIIKEHTIAGLGSYLSASFDVDGIGSAITEIGELSPAQAPHVLKLTSGVYRVVYRRGDNSLGFVEISKTPSGARMQEIAPGVVKINTISAVCLADSINGDLKMGGNPYNGFAVVTCNSSGVASAQAYESRHRGTYGGSVDTGYKDMGSVFPVINVDIPEYKQFSPNNEYIDVYIGPPPSSLAYNRSMRGNSQTVRPALTGTIYVDDLVIPPPAGASISERTILLIGTTAIREPEYDGYQLANEARGLYLSFSLYGTLYLFDGQWIRSANLAVNVLQSLNKVALAQGLQFLAESPQAIFFLSDFDNSLYTFDGGQAVAKMDRYSRKEPILDAVYSVKENTLALLTDDTVMFLRDGGLVGQITLPFVAPYNAFSTSDGIWLSKGSYSIRYLYNSLPLGAAPITVTIDGGIWGTAYADTLDGGVWGTAYPDTIDGGVWGDGSQIVPLVWQSKYNGYSERNVQTAERILFRFYKEDLAPVDILIEYLYFNEAGQFTESKTITLGDPSHPYDAYGYAFLEYIPQHKQSIAFSIRLTCPTKIVYLDIIATVGLHGNSTINSR